MTLDATIPESVFSEAPQKEYAAEAPQSQPSAMAGIGVQREEREVAQQNAQVDVPPVGEPQVSVQEEPNVFTGPNLFGEVTSLEPKWNEEKEESYNPFD